MNNEQSLRYSKHVLLKSLGAHAQENILKSKALIIGCGGLGNAVVPLLAAAGVGHLTLVDDDVIELSNLHRQIQYTTEHIGQDKVAVLADFVKRKNNGVNVRTLKTRLPLEKLTEQCAMHDVIIDCSDNNETRQAVNKASVRTQKPLVFGSAIRTEGYVTVFDPRDAASACYACIFDGKTGDEESSAIHGVFAPIVMLIGALQAAEALKLAAGIPETLSGTLLTYEIMKGEFYPVLIQRNPQCRICGDG